MTYTQKLFIKTLLKKESGLASDIVNEIDNRMKAEKENKKWGESPFYHKNKGWIEALWWAYNKIIRR